MKTILKISNCIFIAISLFLFASCKKDFGNLNAPIEDDFLANASKAQLNNLVTGIESGIRIKLALYMDDVSIVGREIYKFSPSEPRYVTELLGKNSLVLHNAGFYITTIWAANYRVVKNCNILEQACQNTNSVSANEKSAFTGFAKTMKAYSLLLNLNLTYTNGIRIDVADPENVGPIVGYDEALNRIATLLDSAKENLSGSATALSLSAGFAGFGTSEGLVKFNRALAARVAVYRKDWMGAFDCLSGSFLDFNGGFKVGVYSVFGTGTGDIINPLFLPPNQTGEIRVAHPSYVTGIENNDNRISNTPLRNTAASFDGLSSNRDIWVYASAIAPFPIIKNEELILIYSEAAINTGNLINAVAALNIIRNGHGLPDYSGIVSDSALLTEMLKQRRYSLYFEGHRWIDMRRYGRLGDLPIDRADDDVWVKFPLPPNEF